VKQDYNNSSIDDLSLGAKLLGWMGVLPFALAYAAVWIDYVDIGHAVFTGYSAVILSFLGGIRWAQALNGQLPKNDFIVSVMPSLLAWVCLLLPTQFALVGLMLGFIGAAYLDLRARPLVTSRAFLKLRLGLSLSVISLHFAALCQIWFRN
jgi:hypothetical protein